MPVAALFSSHTPLKAFVEPQAGVREAMDRTTAELRQAVTAFAPDLVVAIGPDHFNGFFYRLMPAFCVGAAVESVGDWRTPAGPLPTDADLAERCARFLHLCDLDAALSYRMDVDHGITQVLDEVIGWDSLPAVLPLFVNCAAPPLPPVRRVRALGKALGLFAADLGRRVLLVASGGLSHDPPIPALATAEGAVRERLIDGGRLGADARAARQQRVLDDAGAQVTGSSPQRPLNRDWDRAFMRAVETDALDDFTKVDDATITRDAGCGGHEVRTWIAAAEAARSAGVTEFRERYYRAIPEWVAGYGVMTAGL